MHRLRHPIRSITEPHGRAGLTVAILAAAIAALAAFASSAFAAGAYVNECAGSAFCTAESVPAPDGVAVDNSSQATQGDVYVVHNGGSSVTRFDSAGENPTEIAVPNCSVALFDAVDSATGNIFVGCIISGTVSEITPTGEPVTGFGTNGAIEGLASPAGVAVGGPENRLYVAERGGKVGEFDSSTGAELGEFAFNGAFGNEANSLAVDEEGNVYVALENNAIVKYPVGNREASTGFVEAHGANSVAVDPSTGNVFVGQQSEAFEGEVAEYQANGTPIEAFGAGEVGGAPYGIGVNATSHTVYVSNFNANMGVIFGNGPGGPEQPLTVTIEGTGEGKVTSSPGGINCTTATSPCEHSFEEGGTVTLTAEEEPGSSFEGWTGCTAETGNECEVTMSAPEAVTATFGQNPPQPLVIEVEGEGEVTGTGIACTQAGNGTAACEEEFAGGLKAALSANPAAGNKFEGWTTVEGNAGTCAGTTASCEAGPLVEPTKLKAVFIPTSTSLLTVWIAGEGTVTSPQGSLVCAGESCTGEFEGTVELEAHEETGYVFVGWLGCKHTGPKTCTVSMSGETEVVAVFLHEGAQGPQGEKGEQGEQGEKGEKGNTGNTGAKGDPGTPGANGSNGAQGPKGDTGAAGAQGAQGPQGPAGPKGTVTCKVKQKGKKVKVTCKVSYPASASSARMRWSLTRGGHTVRHGVTSGRRSRLNLGGLTKGRYLLHVQGQKSTAIVVG